MVSILRRENPYVNPYVNPHENASGLDARIISEIQSNARITIQALAEICGKNRDTIRVHLRICNKRVLSSVLVPIGAVTGKSSKNSFYNLGSFKSLMQQLPFLRLSWASSRLQ